MKKMVRYGLKLQQFGAAKDEVLIRNNGIQTYFASDIAYHRNKFDRGFDWVIDIWGQTIPRACSQDEGGYFCYWI